MSVDPEAITSDNEDYSKYQKEELIQIIGILESDLFKSRAENMRMKT